MTRSDPRFRVGLVLTVFGALLFVLVFSLDGTLSWIRGSARVQVRFPTIQGLMEYDPVHFHGVPCGRVVGIDFEPPGPGGIAHAQTEPEQPTEPSGMSESAAANEVSVILTLELPSAVRDYLRRGSQAAIEKTLTGVTVVNLSQGEGPPLGPGEILTGGTEATLTDVAGAMAGAVASLGRILADLEPIIRGLREEETVGSTFARFGTAADEVRELAAQLQRTSGELEEPIRQLTDRAGSVVEELERGVREVPDTLAELRSSVRRLGDGVDDMRKFFGEASPRWRATSEDLAETSGNLRALSAELRRRPWRLLKSPNSKDAAAIDLYESASRYAEGALEVRRALELVRDALARRSADAEANRHLAEALEALEQSLAKQGEVESRFWNRMGEITE